MFIGSAPKELEDLIGVPYLGIESRIIDMYIKHACEDFSWTLTTLVACRTCIVMGNTTEYDNAEGDLSNLVPNLDYEIIELDRPPTKAEASLCKPHIEELIETVQPHGIVLLGVEYKTKLPTILLSSPQKLLDKEYSLLPTLKECHKLNKFITKLYERLT